MEIRKLITASTTLLFGLLVCNSSYANVDLSGTYDVGTLTPLERPAMYGDNLLLSKDQADAMAARFQAYSAQANDSSDPERSAPKAGGAVGGYNLFWIDRGEAAFNIDGKFRRALDLPTSLVF